jgi:hypothetical protein
VPCHFVIILLFEYFNVWVIDVLVFVINDAWCTLMRKIELWLKTCYHTTKDLAKYSSYIFSYPIGKT